MDGTVADKKEWIVIVRQARENAEDNRTKDELSNPKSKLRVWVGL